MRLMKSRTNYVALIKFIEKRIGYLIHNNYLNLVISGYDSWNWIAIEIDLQIIKQIDRRIHVFWISELQQYSAVSLAPTTQKMPPSTVHQ